MFNLFSKPALLSPDLPPGPRQHALALVGTVAVFSEIEIRRGLAAAYDRLAVCGFDPAEAFQAIQERESSEFYDHAAAQAWDEAEASALLTAAAGHERLPLGVMLTLKA